MVLSTWSKSFILHFIESNFNCLNYRLNKDSRHALEWKENLNYLKEWKKGKKDDATIGNLIEILKKSSHT